MPVFDLERPDVNKTDVFLLPNKVYTAAALYRFAVTHDRHSQRLLLQIQINYVVIFKQLIIEFKVKILIF